MRPTHGSETHNCGAPADDENLKVLEVKKTGLEASEFESMKAIEEHIGGNPKGDNCEQVISTRLGGG